MPGLCLGAQGVDPGYNAPEVVAVACNSSSAAPWVAVAGTQQVTNTLSHTCLDDLSASKLPNTDLIAFNCKSPSDPTLINQQWRVNPVSTGVVSLTSLNSGLCLDLGGSVPPTPSSRYLMLAMRIGRYERNGAQPVGYNLYLHESLNATTPGTWALAFGSKQLANGSTTTPIVAGVFYSMSIAATGDSITPSLGGVSLTTVVDKSSAFGMVALGSSWTKSFFDSFKVTTVTAVPT